MLKFNIIVFGEVKENLQYAQNQFFIIVLINVEENIPYAQINLLP